MAMAPVHLQAPSQSLIGTLCAEVRQLQSKKKGCKKQKCSKWKGGKCRCGRDS